MSTKNNPLDENTARIERWHPAVYRDFEVAGADPNLLLPDEIEALMILRERADAAYGRYLDAADATQKAMRARDYAQADYERCLRQLRERVKSPHEPASKTTAA